MKFFFLEVLDIIFQGKICASYLDIKNIYFTLEFTIYDLNIFQEIPFSQLAF